MKTHIVNSYNICVPLKTHIVNSYNMCSIEESHCQQL